MITIAEALAQGSGEWRSFTCPVHADASPSARVNIYSKKWVCMSCGAKGKSDEVEVSIDSQLLYVNRLLEPHISAEHSEYELDMYDIDGPGEYWLNRFSPEACKEFRLGQCGEYPTYPIRDEGGNFEGIVKRNPYGERPKYRYPKGVPTSRYLFGYEKITSDRFVLMEGAPDVISAWEVEVQAVGSYGSILSDRQIALIGRLQPSYVAVAYDDDPAGQKGLRQAIRGLLEAGIFAGPVDLRGYHDVDSIPIEKRGRILRDSLDGKATIDYLLTCD